MVIYNRLVTCGTDDDGVVHFRALTGFTLAFTSELDSDDDDNDDEDDEDDGGDT